MKEQLSPILLRIALVTGLLLLTGCKEEASTIPSADAFTELIPSARAETTTTATTATTVDLVGVPANDTTADSTEVVDTKSTATDSIATDNTSTDVDDGRYDFTLGFAGDINFADDYIPMGYLASIGSTSIADGIDERYIDLMRSMDVMWLNNEFVYSDRGAPLYGKMWTFCSSPEHVSYLQDLGVDIVGLANNHSYDYGKESFLDTLTTLQKAGIPYVGGGMDLEEAMAARTFDVDGFTIAYVAASNAEFQIFTPEATEDEPGILWCYDNTRFLEAIRAAKEEADYVIALPHWGNEHTTVLTSIQTEGAHAYIDAGADIVIGAHPHVLQGIEYYNGKPILYSLGNFWFDGYDIDTAVVALHFAGTKEEDDGIASGELVPTVTIYPGTQSGVYTAWAETEDWRERIFAHLEAISGYAIEIDEDGVLHDTSEDPAYAE